jgi:hypothetical protein
MTPGIGSSGGYNNSNIYNPLNHTTSSQTSSSVGSLAQPASSSSNDLGTYTEEREVIRADDDDEDASGSSGSSLTSQSTPSLSSSSLSSAVHDLNSISATVTTLQTPKPTIQDALEKVKKAAQYFPSLGMQITCFKISGDEITFEAGEINLPEKSKSSKEDFEDISQALDEVKKAAQIFAQMKMSVSAFNISSTFGVTFSAQPKKLSSPSIPGVTMPSSSSTVHTFSSLYTQTASSSSTSSTNPTINADKLGSGLNGLAHGGSKDGEGIVDPNSKLRDLDIDYNFD